MALRSTPPCLAQSSSSLVIELEDEDEDADHGVDLLEEPRTIMDTGILIAPAPGLLTSPTLQGFQLLAQYVGTPAPLTVSLGVRPITQPGTTYPILSTPLFAGVSSAAAPYGGAWYHQAGGCARVDYGRGGDHRTIFVDLTNMQFSLGICDYARVSVQRYNPTLTAYTTTLRITAGLHVSNLPIYDLPYLTAVRFLVSGLIASEAMPIPTRARQYSAWAANETTAVNTGPRWDGPATPNPIYFFTGGGETSTLSYTLNLHVPAYPRWEIGNAGESSLYYAQTRAAPTSHSLFVRFFLAP